MNRFVIVSVLIAYLFLGSSLKAQDTTVYSNTFIGVAPNNLASAYANGFISYISWSRSITQQAGYIQFYDDCGGSSGCGNILSTMPINFSAYDTLTMSFQGRLSSGGGTGRFYIMIEDSLYFYILSSHTLTTTWTTYSLSFIDLWEANETAGFVGTTRLSILYYHNNSNRYGRLKDFNINGIQMNVWMGEQSTDWFTAANWSNGIPKKSTNATIPFRPAGVGRPYYPFIDGSAEVGKLDIEEDAYVAVTPQGTLRAFGALTMGGDFNISVFGDETGMGSFIDNGLSGPGKGYVEQFVSADRWHYMSSPMSNGQAISFYRIFLLPYNEPVSNWGSYISDPYLPLTVMRGYAAWSSSTYPPQGDTIISYAGYLNSGAKSIVTTNSNFTGDPNRDGWNLVGNPFPSGLHWDSAGWTKNNISNTVYYWMPSIQNYGAYQGGTGIGLNGATGEIPVGQGFFVKAIGNGSLGVDNRARIHPSRVLYKSTNINPQKNALRLSVSGNGYQDETVIRFHPDATDGFDGQLDAFKLFASSVQVPQLYSKIQANTLSLSINSMPELQGQRAVPLSFRFGPAGNYVISVSQLENFPNNLGILLEDLVADSMHDIRSLNQYAFYAQTGNPVDRFVIHFFPISIDGMISYNLDPSKPIEGAKVEIRNLFDVVLGSTLSNSQGQFTIVNVEDGPNLVGAEITSLPWGGVNSTDALYISQHFIGAHSLTPLQVKAGDVDASGYLNNADALAVMKRFVGLIDAFPSGDWCVPDVPLLVHGDQAYQVQLGALCYGDVDASYSMPSKSDEWPVIKSNSNLTVNPGLQHLALPVLAGQDGSLAAISLNAAIPAGFRVHNVTCPQGGSLFFNQQSENLLISWMDPAGIDFKRGDVIFTLEVSFSNTPLDGIWLKISGPSEVTNASALVVKNYPLLISSLHLPELQEAFIEIYPNPAAEMARIVLAPLDQDSRLDFSLSDMRGRLIQNWSGNAIEGMPYEETIDVKYLFPGSYILRVSYGSLKGMRTEASLLLIK